MVVDWSAPTEKETDQLLKLSPEYLARVVQRHPQLAAFLQIGAEAIKSVGAEERAGNQHVSDSYFALTNKTVNGLFKRLEQNGVSEEEAVHIYGLLDKLHDKSGEKTSEFLKANDKTGSKTMVAVGLLASVGLSVAIALIAGGRPSTPPPSING